jgi:hypothetical protein
LRQVINPFSPPGIWSIQGGLIPQSPSGRVTSKTYPIFLTYLRWLERPNTSKGNIKTQSHYMKNRFLQIILILVCPRTTSIWCMTTWVTIRQRVRFMNVLWILDNIHYHQITLDLKLKKKPGRRKKLQ